MTFAIPAAPVYLLAKELGADFRETTRPLADDIDARIAAALGVPVSPVTTSMDASFVLKDLIFGDTEYVNVDFREYCIDGAMSFLCDIKTLNSDCCGQGNTRARALVAALLWYVQGMIDDSKDGQD